MCAGSPLVVAQLNPLAGAEPFDCRHSNAQALLWKHRSFTSLRLCTRRLAAGPGAPGGAYLPIAGRKFYRFCLKRQLREPEPLTPPAGSPLDLAQPESLQALG